MINIKTNIGSVAARISLKLGALKDKERIVRSCALQMSGVIRHRIHVQGLDASGKEIGTYSSAYLRLRQRKYNRSADTKIVLSLTSQQENDMGPIETPRGYGIGFKNQQNLLKAIWAEERAGATEKNQIYNLTSEELVITNSIIAEETSRIFQND